ncbi:MAG TPA: alpha/beta fold hydrolase [bacterium]|nr:alpha/beta fold hydrolase [bacterium]
MAEVKLNGARIFYEVHGNHGSFPLVLTHGLGSDHTMWLGQVGAFKDRYRVVLWDVRGHGRSEVTADGYSLDRFIDDLRGLLEHLGIERAHIAGLSMGGWISFEFALKYPGLTAGLVLSDSGGIKAGMTEVQLGQGRTLFEVSAHVALQHGRAVMADNTINLMFSPEFIRQSPDIVELTRRRLMQDPGIGFARTIQGILIDYWNEPAADVMRRLGSITAPTLVIAGDLDLITPLPTQQALHRAIPGSRFEIIHGSGHVPPLEQPAAWNRLVREFLEGVKV